MVICPFSPLKFKDSHMSLSENSDARHIYKCVIKLIYNPSLQDTRIRIHVSYQWLPYDNLKMLGENQTLTLTYGIYLYKFSLTCRWVTGLQIWALVCGRHIQCDRSNSSQIARFSCTHVFLFSQLTYSSFATCCLHSYSVRTFVYYVEYIQCTSRISVHIYWWRDGFWREV